VLSPAFQLAKGQLFLSFSPDDFQTFLIQQLGPSRSLVEKVD
jgi:hypothetical protein